MVRPKLGRTHPIAKTGAAVLIHGVEVSSADCLLCGEPLEWKPMQRRKGKAGIYGQCWRAGHRVQVQIFLRNGGAAIDDDDLALARRQLEELKTKRR